MIHHIADEAEHIYIAYTEVLTIPKFFKNIYYMIIIQEKFRYSILN